MTIYNPIGWVNDSPPPINASNLNHMDAGIVSAHVEIASQAVQIASLSYYASTIYANVGANASAIAVNATSIFGVQATTSANASAIAANAAAVAAQNAAIASNTAGVASVLPAHDALASTVAGLSASGGGSASTISEILATQGYQATQIGDLLATQGAQATQIDELLATQAALVTVTEANASQLAAHATDIYDLEQTVAALGGGLAVTNRSGDGPLDLWQEAAPVGITATSGLPRAIGMPYVPAQELAIASGVGAMAMEVLSNAGVASPTLDFSTAVLDSGGNVIAWSAPTAVPSVATGVIVETTLVPMESTESVMLAGETYYMVVASDDLHRFQVLGRTAQGDAAAYARWRRLLAMEWELGSGLDLASYLSFPLDVASSFSPDGYPGLFIDLAP